MEKLKRMLEKLKKAKKTVLTVLIVVVIALLALSILFAKDRKLIVETEASLKDVAETSQLSTVEYIYNSIVTVSDDKGNPKYYVAYKGTVRAGFDFNEIEVERDRENKQIVIVLPEIKINSVNIDDKSLDFLFVKDKYDTETTLQEAYNASYADLEAKAEGHTEIRKMAYESAVDSMKAILLPLESRLPKGYVFEFRMEGEAE